jgi:RsiW-degrading membrane proteinase PrsW (M82 family)
VSAGHTDESRMTGHKRSFSSVHVYQSIAFVALMATIYVSTSPGPRWKVMVIAAVVALVVGFAASRRYRAVSVD